MTTRPDQDDHALGATQERSPHLSLAALASYGLFGLPLALVALPIYVYVPKYYSEHFALPLATIGVLLLAARLVDAVSDPLLGAWVDHARRRVGFMWAQGYRYFILVALPLLAAGDVALFHPLLSGTGKAPLVWLAGSLLIVYAGFSLASIAYQSWGAELSIDPDERTRIAATREGFGLLGVIAAAVIPGILGMAGLTVLFLIFLLVFGLLLVTRAPLPAQRQVNHRDGAYRSFLLPFRNREFVTLLIVFLANGIASAIPATLVLFFIRDVLGLESRNGLFLGVYFLAGACSMPIWMKLARLLGQARAWLLGMVMSMVSFVWVYALGPNDFLPYLIICVASGVALGADLALPAAILAGVIERAGHRGLREGAYFGLWNFATKFNLAVAAGLGLPLLQWLHYHPEHPDAVGLRALALAYALVPCGLKVLAAVLLMRSSFVRGQAQARSSPHIAPQRPASEGRQI